MKFVTALLALIVGVSICKAASPAYQAFEPTQFSYVNGHIWIKDSARMTNPVFNTSFALSGATYTDNGATLLRNGVPVGGGSAPIGTPPFLAYWDTTNHLDESSLQVLSPTTVGFVTLTGQELDVSGAGTNEFNNGQFTNWLYAITALYAGAQSNLTVNASNLRYTSGLADNATNVAMVIDTSSAWTQGNLINLRNSGSNVLSVDFGGVISFSGDSSGHNIVHGTSISPPAGSSENILTGYKTVNGPITNAIADVIAIGDIVVDKGIDGYFANFVGIGYGIMNGGVSNVWDIVGLGNGSINGPARNVHTVYTMGTDPIQGGADDSSSIVAIGNSPISFAITNATKLVAIGDTSMGGAANVTDVIAIGDSAIAFGIVTNSHIVSIGNANATPTADNQVFLGNANSTVFMGSVSAAGSITAGTCAVAANGVITNQWRLLSSQLLQSNTNVTVDMGTNAPSRRWMIATNDLNFTAANAVDGTRVDLAIMTGATNRNLTFDTNWIWFGGPAPTVAPSNHTVRFSIEYWSGLTNFHCFYSPQLP